MATRVLVLGTGAMASLVGARLARSGRAEVTLAGSWRAALDAVAVSGVTVEDEKERWTVPVRAVHVAGPLPPADLVLALVKSYQTAGVAPAASHAVTRDGLVFTLQNGLGNRETLEGTVGPGHVGVGVVTAGAMLLAPGLVRGHAGQVIFGREPATAARVAGAVELFRSAGFDTDATDDVDALVWRKLAVNCAINPLSALRGVPNGALLDVAEDRRLLAEAAREVASVAAALGIETGDASALAVDVARRTAANRSSMLQDLARGAPTEIDALCGAVVRRGQRLGVPTPVNERFWQEVVASENERADRGVGTPSPQRGGG